MEDDPVFRSLADSTRRRLLDELFEHDGRTLAELVLGMDMTRFGVMKHLRVLETAGLITTRKVGRQKLHYLNAVPIQLLADRWIGKYAERVEALADLKAALETERGNGMTAQTNARPAHVNHTFIKASLEQVWEAITSEEFTVRYFFGARLRSDLQPGSPFNYLDGSGSSPIIEGEVIESNPPRRLVHSYHSLWGPLGEDKPTRVTWELETVADGVTKLTVVHDEFEGETATYKALSRDGGWMWVLSNLKSLLETGEPMAALSR